ncbi:MAG: BBP7 family outer membrane beta-barrel protein [Planctomycetaceae bacterium]|nr:BBP7 family outer membrane beta-barrel protein [Planctomycetaceae bacterium]
MPRVLNRSKPVCSYCLFGLLAMAATSVALGQDSLTADNAPGDCEEGLLPSSFGTAFEKPLESVCVTSCCGPRWTAAADFIALDRVGGVPYALVETVPHSVPLNQLASTPGTVVLNGDDLQQGFSAGPKLGLIRRGDNGCDFELSYFQIDGWNDYRSIGPTHDDWLVMRAAGNFLQTQDLKDTQMMAWDYSSRLYNAEFNVRWNVRDRLALLTGFRWANLSEELQGTLPELPGTWPDRRDPFWNTNVRNNLYGFQIGADGKLLERGRFSMDGLVKAGVFLNNAVETTAVSIDRSMYSESASTNQVACLGELGLQCKYRVTQRLLLKLGYEAIWLQGVALAPGQISDTYCYCADRRNTYVQALGVNCGSGVFYHGATAGLEYSF